MTFPHPLFSADWRKIPIALTDTEGRQAYIFCMRDWVLSLIGMAVLLVLEFVPRHVWAEACSMWKEWRGR